MGLLALPCPMPTEPSDLHGIRAAKQPNPQAVLSRSPGMEPSGWMAGLNCLKVMPFLHFLSMGRFAYGA